MDTVVDEPKGRSHPVISLPIMSLWLIGLAILIVWGYVLHKDEDRERFDVVNGIAACILLFSLFLAGTVLVRAIAQGGRSALWGVVWVVLFAAVLVSVGMQLGFELDSRPGYLVIGYSTAFVLGIVMKLSIRLEETPREKTESVIRPGGAGGTMAVVASAGMFGAITNWYKNKENIKRNRRQFETYSSRGDTTSKAFALAYDTIFTKKLAEGNDNLKLLILDLGDVLERPRTSDDDRILFGATGGSLEFIKKIRKAYKERNLLQALSGDVKKQVVNYILSQAHVVFIGNDDPDEGAVLKLLDKALSGDPDQYPQLQHPSHKYTGYGVFMVNNKIDPDVARTAGTAGGTAGAGKGGEKSIIGPLLQKLSTTDHKLDAFDIWEIQKAIRKGELAVQSTGYEKSNAQKLKAAIQKVQIGDGGDDGIRNALTRQIGLIINESNTKPDLDSVFDELIKAASGTVDSDKIYASILYDGVADEALQTTEIWENASTQLKTIYGTEILGLAMLIELLDRLNKKNSTVLKQVIETVATKGLITDDNAANLVRHAEIVNRAIDAMYKAQESSQVATAEAAKAAAAAAATMSPSSGSSTAAAAARTAADDAEKAAAAAAEEAANDNALAAEAAAEAAAAAAAKAAKAATTTT
jgi:hypothetical protein